MDTTKLQFVYLSKRYSTELCDLFRVVFGRDVDPSYFIYKYGLNNHDRVQCSTIALYEGKVIGFFGCMQQDFLDHKRHITVSVVNSCDYMLLQEFRGKEVFDRIYQHSLERIKDEQYECIFGFHSEQTFKFCQRMGWEEGRSFDRFELPIRKGNLPRVIKKLRGEERMIERIEKALAPYIIKVDMDQFNRFSDCFSRVYDANFFKEKSDHDLRFLVKIADTVMWLKYKHELVAGMVRFLDGFEPQKFQDELLRILKPTGVTKLTFHFQRKTNEHQVFSTFLEPLKSFKITYFRTYEDGCHIDELALNYMDQDIF